MSRIQYIDYPSASPAVQQAYDQQLQATGYITNMKKTLLRSLPAFDALMQWYPLRDVVQQFIGPRGVVIFCHAVSTENDCLICSTYFRKEFADLGIDLNTIEFSPEEKLLETYGRRLVCDPNNVDDLLFEQLREFYSEEQIVVLTAFGGLMIATNLINNTLKVDLDDRLIPYTN